jgi:RNA 2',3'-cyclic 3'-phosphodiesterase
VTRAATVAGDDRLRLFLALELPEDVTTGLWAWSERHLAGGGRTVAHLHVTLAFLGSQPRAALDDILRALRAASGEARPFLLEPVRYRETRAVAMLVLDDPSGLATELAGRLQERLERLGVYRREARPWLPHVTVLRFRERPGLTPPLPEIGPFAPSGAAAFLSRLSPPGARYEVLESCSVGVSEPEGSESGG